MKNEKYIIKYIKTKNKLRKIITYKDEDSRKEHKFIVDKINKSFKPSIFSKGYTKEESIYTNAKAHMYNNYFIKTDIKDFFNSINHNVLKKKIYKELGNVASPKDCDLIVKKCSYYDKGLPLGFITSPVLSNIFLKDFDLQLYTRLKEISCENIIYTRYADDMVISFKNSNYPSETYKRIIKCVKDILNTFHLKLNEKKTKYVDFHKTKQFRITGITIIESKGLRKISIGRNKKKKLFYDAIDAIKSKNKDEKRNNRIKGLLSFYLSVEKKDFDNFLSKNMKKELQELNVNRIQDLIKKL